MRELDLWLIAFVVGLFGVLAAFGILAMVPLFGAVDGALIGVTVQGSAIAYVAILVTPAWSWWLRAVAVVVLIVEQLVMLLLLYRVAAASLAVDPSRQAWVMWACLLVLEPVALVNFGAAAFVLGQRKGHA